MAAYRPDDELLESVAPKEIWQLAFAQAEMGQLRKANNGTVLFEEETGRVLSYGHSLPGTQLSPGMHAEAVALRHVKRTDLTGTAMLNVAVKRTAKNLCSSSQPCLSCLRKMHDRGVSKIIFVERAGEEFHIHRQLVSKLAAETATMTVQPYARMMWLPRITQQ